MASARLKPRPIQASNAFCVGSFVFRIMEIGVVLRFQNSFLALSFLVSSIGFGESIETQCRTCHSDKSTVPLPRFLDSASSWSEALKSSNAQLRASAKGYLAPMYRQLADRGSMPPMKSDAHEFANSEDAQSLVKFLKENYQPEPVSKKTVGQLLPASTVDAYRSLLPKVKSDQIAAILKSPALFFYDESVMPQAYIDDEDGFQGFLYSSDPIAQERTFVISGGKFRFPFGHTAGMQRARAKLYNFLYLPEVNDVLQTVALTNGGRRWIFPEGSYLGEVLYQQVDKLGLVFELRLSWKEKGVWKYEIFRPYPTSDHLVSAVVDLQKQSEFASDKYLAALLEHLANPATLKADSLNEAQGSFGGIHPVLYAAVDLLPPLTLTSVKKLLAVPFQSALGADWRSDKSRKLVCHAPTGSTTSHLAPHDYRMHFYASNTQTCNRCHQETRRGLDTFFPGNGAAYQQLASYGALWGSDQKFSFFPLVPGDNGIPRAMAVNPRLLGTGVAEMYNPSKHPADRYKDTSRY